VERLKENFNIFDFELDGHDWEALKKLNAGIRYNDPLDTYPIFG